MKPIILLTFVIISFSCSDNQKEKQNKQTIIFSNYLKADFKENLKNELHYYILISKFRCTGCVEKNLSELEGYINDKNYKYFTIITSDLKIIPKRIVDRIEIHYDEKNRLDSLNLDIANLTLIEIKGGIISFIKSFNPEDPPVTDYISL